MRKLPFIVFSVEFFLILRQKLLKRNGEIIVGLISGEVHFHTGVDITIMCTIFFHFVCNKLESFSHAVFDHLFLSFFCFFELFDHYSNNFCINLMLIFRVMFKNLRFNLILIFVKVKNQILNEFPDGLNKKLL